MSGYHYSKNICCGCRACEQICAQKCIVMDADKDGFLYPFINNNNCISCGLCKKVCPFRDGGYINPLAGDYPDTYAFYNYDMQTRKNSSSGGAFSALVDAFCNNNYVIFGAGFDENFVVRHSYVFDKDELSKFRKSKYVQSDMGDCYSKVKVFLSEGKKVVFSGTPCQIAGLRTFLRISYENLFCIDVICHGTPSPMVFDKYKQYLTSKYGSELTAFDFRFKRNDEWIPPYMMMEFENGKRLMVPGSDDPFMVGFYKMLYHRPSCYVCPFAKIPRVSDITIGDFIGVDTIAPHLNDNKGLSLILVNTPRGREIFNNMKESSSYLEPVSLENIIQFNPQLEHPVKVNLLRNKFMRDVERMDFASVRKIYLKGRHPFKRLLSNILGPNLIKNIKKSLRFYL